MPPQVVYITATILALFLLVELINKTNKLMATNKQLLTAVQSIATAVNSVGTTITNLTTQLSNSITPAESDDLLAQLTAIGTTLATLNSGTVVTPPNPAFTLQETNIVVGNTTQAVAITAGGTYSSNDVIVATVDSTSGLVTAIASGSAIITYTLPTGETSSETVIVA